MKFWIDWESLEAFLLSALIANNFLFKKKVEINDNLRLIGKDAIINRELWFKKIFFLIKQNILRSFIKWRGSLIVNYYFRKKNNVEFEIIERNRLIENFKLQKIIFL